MSKSIPDYSVSPSKFFDHAAAFAIGSATGFLILFIFYKILVLSVFGGAVYGVINIFISAQKAVAKRKQKLRIQFFDMLEAASVAMRAGNPPLKALQSAREDLRLIYAENSDIIKELDILVGRFNNAVPLSESFADFAKRSKIDDIGSFASIYATIEGKSSRAEEIVRETQQIISDKMEIEMEIETMMAAAKNQGNIMLVMPLVILAVIGYAGAGFMDAIYTAGGRPIATVGLAIFIVSYFLMRKFSNIKL
jgi:tight adherence protein B